ncbi:hypothetical protein OsJ_28620 [Oryza sativa Japonica Group]|uniref:Uncharacterized protein n=1 Tax=Oryza sativa subsp. japonica TaxID=39947 RepID=B9G2H7_ORYSJ|nr:hypothetical protein OsJ_28620 [Oryza sativa Japonica Group]
MMTPEVEACNRDNVWAMLACGVKRKMASGRLRYSSVDVLTHWRRHEDEKTTPYTPQRCGVGLTSSISHRNGRHLTANNV